MNKTNQPKSTNTKQTSSLLPLEQILITGTIFKDLYDPYKVIPELPTIDTEEARLMRDIQTHAMAINDLNLYLDVHPSDETGVQLFNAINERFLSRVKEYEEKYGALELSSPTPKTVPWSWITSNWPWMGDQ